MRRAERLVNQFFAGRHVVEDVGAEARSSPPLIHRSAPRMSWTDVSLPVLRRIDRMERVVLRSRTRGSSRRAVDPNNSSISSGQRRIR